MKELLKEFSQKFDDPALVEDIVQYYWLYLRKAMANKEHFNFSLKGFGNFMINEKKLDRTLAKSHVHLKSLNPKEFKSFARYDAVLHNHQQLAKIKDMIVQENRKGITLKVNRVNDQKSKEHLEE